MAANIFEIIMLICFGSAWPFSILKMLRSKKSHGKSIIFLGVILCGYIAGILFQYFGARNAIIWLYVLNAALVSVDIGLTLYYRDADRQLAGQH